MNVGFTTAAGKYDGGSIGAICSVANGAGIDLSATFKPLAAGDDVCAADAAHDQAAAKLAQAENIRSKISGALEQKQDGGKWSGHGMAASKPSLKSELLAGAAGAAIFAVSPTAGVAYMAAGAVAGAIAFVENAMSMGDGAVGAHAGVQHAAINPGKSAFGSLTKERGKDPILSGAYYEDSMGDIWRSGLAVTNQPAQQSPRPGHAINSRMQAAADIVVDQLGEEKIREHLSSASSAEHRLEQQAAAAKKDWNFKSTRKIEAPSFG
ncbi:MAG: hypothetical protein KBC88_06970 [Alphaproteobacteria bacterium]|nr:hypothetical protein [Alphaproteobacteria bacterium]